MKSCDSYHIDILNDFQIYWIIWISSSFFHSFQYFIHIITSHHIRIDRNLTSNTFAINFQKNCLYIIPKSRQTFTHTDIEITYYAYCIPHFDFYSLPFICIWCYIIYLDLPIIHWKDRQFSFLHDFKKCNIEKKQ